MLHSTNVIVVAVRLRPVLVDKVGKGIDRVSGATPNVFQGNWKCSRQVNCPLGFQIPVDSIYAMADFLAATDGSGKSKVPIFLLSRMSNRRVI